MQDCWICGKPADSTPLGSLLCPGFQARYRDYVRVRSGQTALYRVNFADGPDRVADLCTTCRGLGLVHRLTADDRDAIRHSAGRGMVTAVKAVWDRLGCSIPDTGLAVELLRDHA